MEMAGRGLRRTLTISDKKQSDFTPTTGNDVMRRTFTVSDQFRKDFKPTTNYDDDDNDEDNRSSADTTAVDDEFCRSFGRTGMGMPSPIRGGRTLMDIIREEQKMSGSGSGSIRNPVDGTINWKSFKDRIRLRRAGTAWSEMDPGPELSIGPPSSAPLPSSFARSVTVRASNNASAPGPDNEGDYYGENSNLNLGGGGNDQGNTPLMDLFDGFGSFDSDAGGDDEDDNDYEEEEEEENEEMYHACCVCMVRHKGAAFIPCGILSAGSARGSCGSAGATAPSVTGSFLRFWMFSDPMPGKATDVACVLGN